MKASEIHDVVFAQAVGAIDEGNLSGLEKLLNQHPRLVQERLSTPEEQGYFKDPYLLWFVADNPIRSEKLPDNILELAGLLIRHVKWHSQANAQSQLDYTLELAATGRVVKECGVQLSLIDLLVANGASADGIMGAIAHGNVEAAKHLLKKGAQLNLSAAVCLDMHEEVPKLLKTADQDDLQLALVAAAFMGKAEAVKLLLDHGADPNKYLDPLKAKGFHTHGTALHQAVASSSLPTVEVLLRAGARLDLVDKYYATSPLGWADFLAREAGSKQGLEKYEAIAAYLRAAI